MLWAGYFSLPQGQGDEALASLPLLTATQSSPPE
eukprot:COSAG04_NODE_305_length_17292_cov_72.482173_13_plen_34_part_00